MTIDNEKSEGPRGPQLACYLCTRNDGHLIEAWVRHNVRFFDLLYIVVRPCVDNTMEILRLLKEEGLPLSVVEDQTPEFEQGELATAAYEKLVALGYQWVFFVDTDEYMACRGRDHLLQVLSDAERANPAAALWMPMRTWVATSTDWDAHENPLLEICRHRQPDHLIFGKVALPASLAGRVKVPAGFHHAEWKNGSGDAPVISDPGVAVNHFPWQSPEQFFYKSVRSAATWAAEAAWAWGKQTYAGNAYMPFLREHGGFLDGPALLEAGYGHMVPKEQKATGYDNDERIISEDARLKYRSMAKFNVWRLLDAEVEQWATRAAAKGSGQRRTAQSSALMLERDRRPGTPVACRKVQLWNQICSTRRTCSNAGADIRGYIAAYIEALGVKRSRHPARILVVVGEIGIAAWRVWPPYLAIAEDPEYDVRIVTHLQKDGYDLDWADIIVLVRTAYQPLIPVLEEAQKRGKLVVYDNDDIIHAVPPWSAAYGPIYQQNQPYATEAIMDLVTVVSVSTPYIAQTYANYARALVVLPNCVDFDMWPIPDFDRESAEPGRLNIGWIGSPTHAVDLGVLVAPLASIMRRYPAVHFLRGGWGGPDRKVVNGESKECDIFEAVPQERYERLGWDEFTHTLPKYMRRIDVGVSPLVNCELNRGKSDCRLLQDAAMGIASVATDIEAHHSQRGYVILVQNDPEQWARALDEVIRQPDMRRAMAVRAYQHAVEECSIYGNIWRWKQLFQAMLNGKLEEHLRGGEAA